MEELTIHLQPCEDKQICGTLTLNFSVSYYEKLISVPHILVNLRYSILQQYQQAKTPRLNKWPNFTHSVYKEESEPRTIGFSHSKM